MQHILVTGANGQLGSELNALSEQYNHRFTFTDVDTLDITNRTELKNRAKEQPIDIIINCAAYTNVDKAEDDTEMADKINHLAVQNLAEVTKETNATLIHISTDYVFDGSSNTPYQETSPTSPLGVYGSTKLLGEQAIEHTGCKHIIIRTSWLYSVYGSNFVKTMQRLTTEKEQIKVVFDQIGTPTYAADLAKTILDMIGTPNFNKQQSNTYHFSNEGVCSWFDFAIAIRNLFGNSCRIQPCHSHEFPAKVTRPHYSVLDKTKIKNTFGVEIPYWKDALERCVERIRESKK